MSTDLLPLHHPCSRQERKCTESITVINSYLDKMQQMAPKLSQTLQIGLVASLCALVGGWTYQKVIEKQCYLELATLLIANILFWLLVQMVFTYLERKYPQCLKQAWYKLPVTVVFLTLNFILGYSFLWFILGIVFHCDALQITAEHTILSSGLFIHFCAFFLIPGNGNNADELTGDVVNDTGKMIFVRHQSEMIAIKLSEIVYIQTDRNTLILHTMQGRYVLYQSLRRFLMQQNHPDLIRVHRSYAVNINFVQRYKIEQSGDGSVIMRNGIEIKLSRHYRKLNF